MPHLPTILKWLDIAFTVAGCVVVLVAALWWWLRWLVGHGNPLRHAPIRTNRLNAVHVWLCFFVNFLGAWIGQVIAKMLGYLAADGSISPPEAILSTTCGEVFVIVTCLVVARHVFIRGWRGLGIGRRPFLSDLKFGIAGWLSALAVCGFLAWAVVRLIVFLSPDFEAPKHSVFKVLDDPAMPRWLSMLALVGAALLAPVAEELLFRGILQTGLKKLFRVKPRSFLHRWLAIAVTSLLFGLMHYSATPQYVPALIAMGFILGYLYERHGSLLIPILVHILFNGKMLLWRELLRFYENG